MSCQYWITSIHLDFPYLKAQILLPTSQVSVPVMLLLAARNGKHTAE